MKNHPSKVRGLANMSLHTGGPKSATHMINRTQKAGLIQGKKGVKGFRRLEHGGPAGMKRKTNYFHDDIAHLTKPHSNAIEGHKQLY